MMRTAAAFVRIMATVPPDLALLALVLAGAWWSAT
jgi:hypothetical protein